MLAHNFNDVLALKLVPVDIIRFIGAIAGSSRFTASITVSQNSSSTVLGQLGTKMMMQTCVFDSVMMRIVGLEPA